MKSTVIILLGESQQSFVVPLILECVQPHRVIGKLKIGHGLTLAKEYYDGNGINEEYTYSSPIQNRGDNLLIEDTACSIP